MLTRRVKCDLNSISLVGGLRNGAVFAALFNVHLILDDWSFYESLGEPRHDKQYLTVSLKLTRAFSDPAKLIKASRCYMDKIAELQENYAHQVKLLEAKIMLKDEV